MYVCTYVCMYACMYVRTYVGMYVRMYVYTYIYIYMYVSNVILMSFEVPDTVAVLGVWDHDTGNYSGSYSIGSGARLLWCPRMS